MIMIDIPIRLCWSNFSEKYLMGPFQSELLVMTSCQGQEKNENYGELCFFEEISTLHTRNINISKLCSEKQTLNR